MNCRDRKSRFRPESIQITNQVNEALAPIMKKALKWGLSLDAFYYLVASETNELICAYVEEKKYELENGET